MSLTKLRQIQAGIAACSACPRMIGPPVHGTPVLSPILLLGQAPGPREGSFGKPFAYTAGKTLFRWFEETAGVDEEHFRSNIYMAAVARCFPGKAATGGGDRLPDAEEIEACGRHLMQEMAILEPKLILAVGRLAIEQVLGRDRYGPKARLTDVVGKLLPAVFHGQKVDAICLPHPSGLSAWHKTEPGKTLLKQALQLVRDHPAWGCTY